jgi:flagellar biosynthesis/type III secretory pathway protein FliH
MKPASTIAARIIDGQRGPEQGFQAGYEAGEKAGYARGFDAGRQFEQDIRNERRKP